MKRGKARGLVWGSKVKALLQQIGTSGKGRYPAWGQILRKKSSADSTKVWGEGETQRTENERWSLSLNPG